MPGTEQELDKFNECKKGWGRRRDALYRALLKHSVPGTLSKAFLDDGHVGKGPTGALKFGLWTLVLMLYRLLTMSVLPAPLSQWRAHVFQGTLLQTDPLSSDLCPPNEDSFTSCSVLIGVCSFHPSQRP